ncbi:iron complex transport system permease protein [Arcanobacterium pluranimalium]|uniref:FecCD family ABC transporter permease n=1 Tax=Arcanobacterium pluranimalium TaxID=108028 RepID=UPI001956196D|nr:iron ABC transporter permease [Arcanobacterium pluranimalium]MBM7824309.1 iron complex transport system permease protein [Arcanobacterium pluranimalium]
MRWHIITCTTLLLGACILSVAVGARPISIETLWHSWIDPSQVPGPDLAVIHSRLARTLTGLLVGIALALSGAVMQGMTRNPLADPGLLGLNAGAASAVVLSIYLFGTGSVLGYASCAFIGAACAAALVYTIASLGKTGATPVRLALAGAALTAGLSSITSAILLIDQQAVNQFRMWQMGVLGARTVYETLIIAPFIGLGALVVIAFAARLLNILVLGDATATSLGINVNKARMFLAITVVLLAGAATALAGPIGFLGLIVPHTARLLIGGDYKQILALSLILGPLILIGADVIGRIILPPTEIQAGVMTAFLGAPVFIALVRTRKQVQL